ncbi:LrgB family protein [Paraglaciecola aestuariivivens]
MIELQQTMFELLTYVGVVGATLGAYLLALVLFSWLQKNLLFHPILLAAGLIIAMLYLFGLPLHSYQNYMQPLAWLLGPVTVALAVPLFQQFKTLAHTGSANLVVIISGGILAPLSAICLLWLLGFAPSELGSVLTKSITTPLAMDTASLVGGIPEFAAAIVIFTGLIGVLFSRLVFKLTGCHSPEAQGLSLGIIAHAIGTAHAQQLGSKAVAFATLALCINGVLTATILSIMFYWLN